MKNKRGKFLIITGLLFIIAALVLTGYNLIEAKRAEEASYKIADYLADFISEGKVVSKYEIDPNMEMPTMEVDGIEYVGLLTIPDLQLTLPVINEWSYNALTIAPCRYTGTAYKNNLVIAAHNYTSHFGNLKKLQEGAEVRFTDMNGNIFKYEVASLETLEATAVEEMTDSQWDLTLFTCTIGGRARVTLRCENVG